MKNVIHRLDKISADLESLGLQKFSKRLDEISLRLSAKPANVKIIIDALKKITESTKMQLTKFHESLKNTHESDIESQHKLEKLTDEAAKFLNNIHGQLNVPATGWESTGSRQAADKSDASLFEKAQKVFDLVTFAGDRFAEALYDLERHVPKNDKENEAVTKTTHLLKKAIPELRHFSKRVNNIVGKTLSPTHSFSVEGIKNLDDLITEAPLKQAIYTQDEGGELEIDGVKFYIEEVQEVRRLLKEYGVTDVQVPAEHRLGFESGDPIPGDYKTEDFLDMLKSIKED